jgi:hypothetical protein
METAAEMSDLISGKMEALISRVLAKLKEWGVDAVPVKASIL